MSGWGFGKQLLGAVTEGVKDLVQPDFIEDGEDGERRTRSASNDYGWGDGGGDASPFAEADDEEVLVSRNELTRLQRTAKEHAAAVKKLRRQEDTVTALQDEVDKLRVHSEQVRRASMGSASADASAAAAEIAALKQQVEQLRTVKIAYDETRREMKALKAELTELEGSAAAAEALRAENAALQRELEEVRSSASHVDPTASAGPTDELQDEIRRLTKDLSAVQARNDAEVSSLQAELAARTADAEALNGQLGDVTAQQMALTEERGGMEAEMKELRDLVEELQAAQLQPQPDPLQEQLKDAMEANRALQAEIDVIHEEQEAQRGAYQALEVQLEAALDETRTLRADAADQQRVAEEHQTEHATRQERVAALEAQLAARADVSNDEHAALTANLAALEARLVQSAEALTERGGELDAMKSRLAEAEDMLARAGDNGELEATVARQGTTIAALEGELGSKDATIHTLEDEKQTLSNEVEELRNAAPAPADAAPVDTELQAALEAKDAAIAALEDEKQTLSNEVEELRNAAPAPTDAAPVDTELQAALEAKDAAIAALEDEKQTLSNQVEELREMCDQMGGGWEEGVAGGASWSSWQDESQAKEKEVEEAKGQVAVLEEQVRAKGQEVAEWVAKEAALSEKLCSAEFFNASVGEENSKLKAEVQDFKKRSDATAAALATLQDSMLAQGKETGEQLAILAERHRASLEKKAARIKQLENEVANAQRRADRADSSDALLLDKASALAALEAETASLKDQLQAAAAQAEASAHEAAASSDEVTAAQALLTAKDAAYSALEAEAASLRAELTEQAQAHAAQADDSAAALLNEAEDLKARLADEAAQHAASQEQLAAAEGRAMGLEDQLAALEDAKAHVEAALAEQTSVLQSAQEGAAALTEQLSDAEERLAAAEAQSGDASASQRAVEELTEALAVAQAAAEEGQGHATEARELAARVVDLQDDLQRAAAAAAHGCAAEEGKAEALMARAAELEAELRAVRTDAEQAAAREAALAADQHALQQQYDAAVQKAGENAAALEAELAALREGAGDGAATDVAHLEGSLAEARDELEATAVEAAALRSEAATLRTQMEETLSAAMADREALSDAQDKLAAATAQVSALEDTNQQLQRDLAAASPEPPAEGEAEAADPAPAADGQFVLVPEGELEGLKEQVRAITEAKEEEKKAFDANIEQYRAWHQDIQKTYDAAVAESEHRRAQLDQQYKQLEEYHAHMKKQSDDAVQQNEVIITLKASLTAKEQDLEATKRLLIQANEDLDELQEDAGEKDGEQEMVIARLSAQLKEVSTQLAKERQMNEEDRSHAVSRVDADMRERSALLETVSKAEAEAARVEAESSARIDELAHKLAIRDEEVAAMQERLAGFKTNEDERDYEVTRAAERANNLQTVLDSFVAEREQDIKRSTEGLMFECKRLTDVHDLMKADVAAKAAELEELKKSITKERGGLNATITALQNKIAQMRDAAVEAAQKANTERFIEKDIVTKLFSQYVGKVKERQDLTEILALFAAMLNWSEEDKVACGMMKKKKADELGKSGSWWGVLTPGKDTPSLSEQWVSFLMTETAGSPASTSPKAAPSGDLAPPTAPSQDVTMALDMSMDTSLLSVPSPTAPAGSAPPQHPEAPPHEQPHHVHALPQQPQAQVPPAHLGAAPIPQLPPPQPQ